MYRIVIADDESMIRAGLREILPWEELGMRIEYEAENGTGAYEYLREHYADVLITDIRMEGMDGLELIEKAKTLYPQLHCIILTGFNDFAYTKQAIRLGIENYILKPVDENELMETLVSIENKLEQQQKGNSVPDKEKQVILQLVLVRWLTGNIEEAALRHRAAFLGLPLDGSYFQTCVLRVLESKSAVERQRIGMALIRAWKPLEDVWMRVCWDINRDLVLVFSGELVKRASDLRKQVEDFIRITGWDGKTKLFAAFGTLQEDVLQLEQSYRDARTVAELSMILPEGSVVEYAELDYRKASESIPQMDFERLEAAIREGNEKAIGSLWDGWKRDISHVMADPKLIKSYATETMCRLIILQMDTFPSGMQDWDKQKVLEELFEARTLAELSRELKAYSISFSRRVMQAHELINPSVRRCIETVEKHFDQQLTLRGLAEQFHVNPVYLGRLFKEETGQAFTAYLNQVRIREAKRLLIETDKSVALVSAAVGYLSQGYFTNLFKKSVGCFPREYRLKQR